jgi:hypothetical protein
MERRPLIIVERDELQLYIYLCEDYAAETAEIIFDRRHTANRRRAEVRPAQDRRRRQRRTYDVSRALNTYGWVIVHHPSSSVKAHSAGDE